MPRPKSKAPDRRAVMAYCTADEKNRIKSAATAAGSKSLSTWILSVLLAAATGKTVHGNGSETQQEAAMLSQAAQIVLAEAGSVAANLSLEDARDLIRGESWLSKRSSATAARR